MVRATAFLAVLALALTACSSGSSSVQVYRDPDRQTKFEVPADWRIYDGTELSGIAETPFVTQDAVFEFPVVSRVVFDASPSTSPAGIGVAVADADFPIGSSVVRRIPVELREHVSRYVLAEAVLPYHSHEVAEERIKQDFKLDNDFEGVQLMIFYREDAASTDGGAFFISLTDPDVTTLYTVAVGCSLECFSLFADDIVSVVDSWLVNTRE